MALLLVMAVAACGGRAEHSVAATDASAAPSPEVVTCKPGDPTVTLATGAEPGPTYETFNGLVSDGRRVYVAQSTAPQFWSLSTQGGDIVAHWSSQQSGVTITSSTPMPMLPSDGGFYFATLDSPEHLVWASGLGGPVRIVSSTVPVAFDWSGSRAFSFEGPGPSIVQTISLSDGSTRPFGQFDAGQDVQAVGLTERFLHLIVVTNYSPIQYADERIALADGVVQDRVPFPADNTQVFFGPTAVCALASDAKGIECIADSEAAGTYIPVTSSAAPFPRYLDAHWVYAAVYGGRTSSLARFSLDGASQEVLATDLYPSAVTSFGGCVYVAGAGETILRIAAP